MQKTDYSDYEYILHVWNKVFRKYVVLEEPGRSNRVSKAYNEFNDDYNEEDQESDVSLECKETVDLNYSRQVLDVLRHNKKFLQEYKESQYDDYMKH